MKLNEKEVYNDAVEAIAMSGGIIDFEDWVPGWMINENGDGLIEDEELKCKLKTIWDKANKKH